MALSLAWLCRDRSVPRGRYWRSNLLVFSFEPRLDLGGQGQALMIGELFSSIPGQRSVKFTGQPLRLFDQRRDDAFSILVRDLDQHHVARMTFDKRCDIAVPGTADQVALPMARHGAIFNGCGSFADGHGILYLAEPVSFQAGVLGAADGTFLRC